MMRITINKDSKGLVNYFTRSLKTDDYFFTGKDTVGFFSGKLMDDLSLPHRVTKKAFSRLAHNRHPVTGNKLTPRNVKNRIASFEYTFSAPKSVSILIALGHEETAQEILNAHRYAVRQAMIEIENNLHIKTRINGRQELLQTEGIVTASFTHFTSRPTKEKDSELAKYSSDPNLHTHCIVPNIGKFNGRFLALDGGGVHRSASYYESIYHAHLSGRLRSLNYNIQKTKDRWEIQIPNLTRRTIEKFSRRTIEIEALAKTLGITNAKKKATLGASSRLKKSTIDPNLDLKSLWLSKLTEKEYEAIKNPKGHPSGNGKPITATQAIDKALEHFLERQSTIPVKKLLSYALNLGYGRLLPADVHKALQSRENVVYGRSRYLELLTTKEMIRAEDKMLEWVSQRKGTMVPLNPDYTIQQDFLNTQQQKAIQTILRSQDQVTILNGGAGTGKSTILHEIKMGIEQLGKRVVAIAPSATASRDVLRSKGFKNADTIASFLRNKEMQAQTKNQTILIDEASLIGIGTFNKIKTIAKKNKARLILSGDIHQMNSPEAGDAMRLIVQKSQPTVASIDIIQRQNPNPQYKLAVGLLAKGETLKGFNRLDKMKAVIEIDDPKKRYQHIAEYFYNSILQKKSALIIAPTHAESLIINEQVRQELKKRGRIQKSDRSFTIQKNLSLTNAQKKEVSQYEEGMSVQFFQNIKGGIKAGNRYDILFVNKEGQPMMAEQKNKTICKVPLEQAEHFQVYKKAKINFAVGEHITITENGKTKGNTRINNGQSFRIKSFTPKGDIQLSTGKIIDKDFANLNYAYCSTVHKSQGKTCDDVYLAMGSMSLPAVTKKTFYVGASRARERIQIITDDKQSLKEAILKTGDRMSANDLLKQQKQKSMTQLRRKYYEDLVQKIYRDDRSKQKYKNEIHKPYQ